MKPDSLNWLYIPMQKNIRNRKINLPELVGLGIFILIGGVTFFLAVIQKLSPFILFLLLVIHFTVNHFIKVNTYDTPVLLHFYHNIIGMGLFSMVFASVNYYLVWILQGATVEAQRIAESCVIFTFIMMFWVLFASVSIIGVYFSIMLIYRWFPYFVRIVPIFETPFILYIVIVVLGLFALGGWLTHIFTLWAAVFQKEHYDKRSDEYYRYGKWILSFSACFSVIFVIVENSLQFHLLRLIFPDYII